MGNFKNSYGSYRQNNGKANHGILVCAHRSYHKNAPENSIASIVNAIAANIDLVELDVRTTKDSVLVLMHDETLDRTTTGSGLVSNYTLTEISQLNLRMGDSITSHKIPRLSEALMKMGDENISNLDLKAVNYHQLYDLLRKFGMEHEVISFIGTKEKVFEMTDIDSLYATLPLSETKSDMYLYCHNTQSSLQHLTDESYTDENMKWAHENGELIFVNALWGEDEDFIAGRTDSMDNIILLRPAIIQTDNPKLLAENLKSKGFHD